jgi:(p)ppGpp synthase/HD superfamily hydrolase
MEYTNELVIRAYNFAKQAHEGQTRKYTGEPYFNHPVEVAEIVSEYSDDPEVIAASLLHDVVEDTYHTLDEIREMFGERVAIMVENMTDVSKPEDGNRATRRAIDREHSAKSTPEGKMIKMADVFANCRDLLDCDRNFARVYIPEKMLLIKVLRDGHEELYGKVAQLLIGIHNELKSQNT